MCLAPEAWHARPKRAWPSLLTVLASSKEGVPHKSPWNYAEIQQMEAKQHQLRRSCWLPEPNVVLGSDCREVAGQGVLLANIHTLCPGEIPQWLSLRLEAETASARPNGCSARTMANSPALQWGFLLRNYRDVSRRTEISNILTVTIND